MQLAYDYVCARICVYDFLKCSQAAFGKFFKCFCPINQVMVKKVSLNIPDDIYEKLASLSDFYGQDVKNAIVSILDAVGWYGQRVMNLGKEYKVPVKLSTVMSHVFGAGFDSIYSVFNRVLEILEVKGLYTLTDFDIDLDENYMWFSYAALIGCDLQVDALYVDLRPGLKTLTTNSYIEVKEVNNKALKKLEKLVRTVEVPEEFERLEDYNIEIEEDEEFWTLRIDCTDESLNYLPSVKRISEFVAQVFKKAGII